MRFLSIFFAYLLSSTLLFAQYTVSKRYGVGNNLDSDEILKIFLDSRETLWVSTKYGVYYKKMDKFQLLHNFSDIKFNNVKDIYEDDHKNLWFASYGNGLIFYDGQKVKLLTTKNGLVSNKIRKIKSFRGRIYVTGVNGISIIDPKTHKIITPKVNVSKSSVLEGSNFLVIKNKLYVSTINDGVFLITDDRLILVNRFKRILNSYVYKDRIFLSENNGISNIPIDEFLKGSNKNLRLSRLPIIWDYEEISNDNYWIAAFDNVYGVGGILNYKNNQISDITKELNIDTKLPSGIVYDRKNNVTYISTLDNGLFKVLMNSPTKFHNFDKEVINIRSTGDYNYFISKKDFNITYKNKLIKIIEAEQFIRYIQPYKEKYSQQITRQNNFLEINFDIKPEYFRLYKLIYQKNKIWVSSNIGIFIINVMGEIEKYYPIHTKHFQFYQDKIIESNPYGGVKLYTDIDKLEAIYYPEANPNTPTNVVTICRNKNAVFLGSSLDGLFKFQDGKFLSYSYVKKFTEDKIKIIKCIPDDRLLVATEYGDIYILKIFGDDLKIEKKINKKIINSININLINEINGKIIIGTTSKIIIIDQDKIYHIDNEQGLSFDQIYWSTTNEDKLLIGTDKGYYTVSKPYFSNLVVPIPELKINRLKVNNVEYQEQKFLWSDLIEKDINLMNHENNVTIEFLLQNPKYPSKFQYRYRLNQDKQWSESFTENIIYLSSLKFGQYNVEIEITDLNNGQRKVVKLMQINISPPFYLTNFFILASILLIVLILYKIYKIRIHHVNQINLLKIQQINEINEVNQNQIILEKKLSEIKLIALQSQMNPHFIFNVLNTIQFYVIENDVEKALYAISKFSRLIRLMLDLSSLNTISLGKELEFVELYLKVENLRYKEPVQLKLDIDPTIDVHQINIPPIFLQPIIENSLVHGFSPLDQNKLISIKLENEGDFISIIIQDNGKGIFANQNKEKLHESKGLKILSERLQIFNNRTQDDLIIDINQYGVNVIIKLKINKY